MARRKPFGTDDLGDEDQSRSFSDDEIFTSGNGAGTSLAGLSDWNHTSPLALHALPAPAVDVPRVDFTLATEQAIELDAAGGSQPQGYGEQGSGEMSIGTDYDIVINYTGDARYRPAFDTAEARWEQIITGEIPDVNSSQWGLIDDLRIDATIEFIDGAGNVLGSAGPDRYRSSWLPYHGSMRFDSADIENLFQSGQLDEVVLHEIAHIIGIGTIWGQGRLGFQSGGQYTGQFALAEYRILAGNPNASFVPVETDGGAGTAFGHWDEQTFNNELLTGFLDSGANPISRMTIAALRDFGYTVDLGQADPYQLPNGPAPPPDLYGFLRTQPTTVTPGGSLAIDATIVNQGSGAAAASTTGYYLSTDQNITTSDILLSARSTAALAAYQGGTYWQDQAFSVTLPGNLAPGTYYLAALADSGGVIGESNETNNAWSKVQITVSSVTGLPDLYGFLRTQPATVVAGGNLAIDATIVNQGSNFAAASTTGYYLSTDQTITTSDILLSAQSTAALAPYLGGTYWQDQAFSVTLPGNLAPGTYYLGALADSGGVIGESSETNNAWSKVQITVTAGQPDLYGFLRTQPTTVTAGDSLAIDAIIVNQGNGGAAASTTGYYLSTDQDITTSDTLLSAQSTAALAAYQGGTYWQDQAFSVTLPGNLAPGTYYLGALADSGGVIGESNETNNAWSKVQITVTAAGPTGVGLVDDRDETIDFVAGLQESTDNDISLALESGAEAGVWHTNPDVVPSDDPLPGLPSDPDLHGTWILA